AAGQDHHWPGDLRNRVDQIERVGGRQFVGPEVLLGHGTTMPAAQIARFGGFPEHQPQWRRHRSALRSLLPSERAMQMPWRLPPDWAKNRELLEFRGWKGGEFFAAARRNSPPRVTRNISHRIGTYSRCTADTRIP